MEGTRRYPRGSVFGGSFSETAAWARYMVEEGRWTPEKALQVTECAYRRTMLEQLMGIPQPELPEELPEHSLLFM